MKCGLRRLLKQCFLIVYVSAQVIARAPAVPGSSAPPQNLSEFEGLYEYRDGGALFIVTSGARLVAIR